jgi:hypothetical protein
MIKTHRLSHIWRKKPSDARFGVITDARGASTASTWRCKSTAAPGSGDTAIWDLTTSCTTMPGPT